MVTYRVLFRNDENILRNIVFYLACFPLSIFELCYPPFVSNYLYFVNYFSTLLHLVSYFPMCIYLSYIVSRIFSCIYKTSFIMSAIFHVYIPLANILTSIFL
jgi:exosortase/archaeosortase